MTTVEPVERKRGGCLTAFLVLMLIANPLTALYYLFAGSAVRQALPSMQGWVIPVLGLFGAANFVFAIGIWNWKKWGVYGFAASAIIIFLINIISVGFVPALFGLIGVVLLAFLVRPVWNQME